MNPRDELIALETEGWRALCADGAAAMAFYPRVLGAGRRRSTSRPSVRRSNARRPTSTTGCARRSAITCLPATPDGYAAARSRSMSRRRSSDGSAT